MGIAAQEPLLEREKELAALQQLLERALDGDGRLALLEGPAGIGKTRLLQATRDSAKTAGMRVLTARATELERDFPFAVVRQLFESVLHALDPSERDTVLADAARPAAAVVGVAARERAEGAIADPSFAVLNGLYWLTSNLGESAPTLVAVDDAHWADAASLRFFDFLAPRLEDLPVLLAIAARPSEPGADPNLLDHLSVDAAARMLRPHALSPAAVAELVRSRLSAGAEDEFCAAAHEATGGNPFLLHELLLELSAEGSGGTAGEAHHLRELAPATIQRAVLLRLARLPAEAGRLARAVAVLGDDAEPRQARALALLDAHAATADALVAAGILEHGRPLRFVHPLVRNAVYADITDGERAALHWEAAKLLEAERAEPERIAIHLLATDPDNEPGVVEALDRAAQRALNRAAPEAAVSYLRRALADTRDPGARRNLMGHLATAAFRAASDSAVPGDLLTDMVEELAADPEALMASAVELSALLETAGRESEGIAVLERAADAAIAAGDHSGAMRFESLIVWWAKVPPTRQGARWDRYRDHIEPDTPGERLWLTLRAWSQAFEGGRARTAATLAERALEGGWLVREQPDSPLSGVAIYVLFRADELDAAARAIDQYSSEVQTSGSVAGIASALFLRAELEYVRGEIAEAEPDARAAVGAWHRLLSAFPHWLALLINVLVERDELEAAEHELELSGLGGEVPGEYLFIPLLYSRGCLRLAQGRTHEALADLGEVAMRSQRDGIKNIALGPTAAVMAITLAGSGQQELARGTAQLYLDAARAWDTPRTIGIGLHALGVVEGGETGIELMREAVVTLEGSPARLEHAKALTDLGAALRRANRRAEARAPLREALEWARRAGALAVAKRAHEELEATGEKLGPLIAGGVESLTPSERRIAALAADGLTNRQIAQTLFLSVKTVESHLHGAYRKLDITSRAQLGGALEGAASS